MNTSSSSFSKQKHKSSCHHNLYSRDRSNIEHTFTASHRFDSGLASCSASAASDDGSKSGHPHCHQSHHCGSTPPILSCCCCLHSRLLLRCRCFLFHCFISPSLLLTTQIKKMQEANRWASLRSRLVDDALLCYTSLFGRRNRDSSFPFLINFRLFE